MNIQKKQYVSKSEKIKKSTLEKIREILPNIKIIQWYVDHLLEKNDFFEKLNCLDAKLRFTSISFL